MFAESFRKPASRRGLDRLRAALGELRARLLVLWAGPPDFTAALRMERRFIALRYLGISFLAPTLPLLSLSASRLVAAYVLLLVYGSFNVWVHVLLNRRSPWLNHGYVTSIGDGIIISIMVMIGGGFASPFYMLLFPTTIAAAMRFGYGPSLLIVGFYVAFDALTVGILHGTGAKGDFLFRSGYLTLTALLASYLWEQARVAEAALETQLMRARALNESSQALNTSLQIDTVVETVAEESRRLVAADVAMLKLGATHKELVIIRHGSQPFSRHAGEDAAIKAILDQYAEREEQRASCGISADGRPFMVVRVRGRDGVSGVVVVVRNSGAPFTEADRELLLSFIERATLAIENASLYKTIGDRSQDLQRAYADLAAAHQDLLGIDEMKTSFIANVSHELRTPLTSIRAFSEILLTMEVDAETTHEFVGMINTESERLTRLINDVLDITKIEAGYVEWNVDDLDLQTLLATSVKTFSSLAEEKNLRLDLVIPETLPLVRGNWDRITQVLANLMGNALKFTTQGSITLSCEVLDSAVHIHVADTGIGIAPEHQGRIFEKFHQVGDTLTDKPKGTGLGLCICREIVMHHGGQMWVKSVLGAGSTFSFSLPIPSE
jgi:signal transduction histidine kinase/microcompartment protein CcmK/EutM